MEPNTCLKKGAIIPDKPLSLEHWLDSLGFASALTGMSETAKQAISLHGMAPSVRIPSQQVPFRGKAEKRVELYKAKSGSTGESQYPLGGGKSETLISNQGKVIDFTPFKRHVRTNRNPGYKGEPNSSVDILDKNGNIATRRWFDAKGNAVRDVDMTNHFNPKRHPEWPHEHFWDYNTDGNPSRK